MPNRFPKSKFQFYYQYRRITITQLNLRSPLGNLSVQNDRTWSLQRSGIISSVPIRLTQTPTIYSMRQPWRRNAVRRRIDKGSGQFLTVLKSGGGLKSLRKLNSEEGWVNGKHIQRGSC